MPAPTTNLKIVFGAMTIGAENTLGARVYTAKGANALLDTFQSHGHNEIDTARVYGNGTTETLLSQCSLSERGIVVDTKLYPNKGTPMVPDEQYTHTASDVRKGLMASLKASARISAAVYTVRLR